MWDKSKKSKSKSVKNSRTGNKRIAKKQKPYNESEYIYTGKSKGKKAQQQNIHKKGDKRAAAKRVNNTKSVKSPKAQSVKNKNIPQKNNIPEGFHNNDFLGKTIRGEYDDRYYDEAALNSLKKKKKNFPPISRGVRRFRKIVLSCLIVMVVLTVGITLSLTVFFKTGEFEINGKTRYEKQEIIDACGIEMGENIFLADKTRSEENIINAFPYIAEAQVTFGIPDKIVINIKEGKPCYMVKYSKKQFCVVSQEGRILKNSSKKISKLPLVKGVKLKSDTPGSYVEYNNEKNSKTLTTLVNSLTASGFENLTEINVSKKAKLTFTYDKRILVQLGLPEDIDYKVRTAKAIITDKLDPNNTGLVEGVLDVSSCKETRRSYFNEKTIVPEEEKASSTTTNPTDSYYDDGSADYWVADGDNTTNYDSGADYGNVEDYNAGYDEGVYYDGSNTDGLYYDTPETDGVYDYGVDG